MGGQRGRAVRRVLCTASLAVGLGAAGAATIDAEGRIVLTADEMRACNTGDGCVLLPRALVLQLLELAEKGESLKCGADWKRTT